MKRIAFATIIVMAVLDATAFAGTIRGKVSGISGESVVYVEAVAGITAGPKLMRSPIALRCSLAKWP